MYKGLKSIYTKQPYSILKCLSCGNGITFPQVNKELLQEIYAQTYLYPIHLLALGEKKYRARAMAQYIRKHSSSKTHPKLLEAGCMFGYLLNELKNDYQVKGIDIGRDAIEYCHKTGLDVEENSVEDYIDSTKEKFDVIVISHVLEHLLHPEIVLQRMKAKLNPGGRIYILVPNSDSINAKLFGRYWGWWQVPVHINHFNQNSLEKLALTCGYKIAGNAKKGGDSLMILLNFINLFSFSNKNTSPGLLQRLIIKTASGIFRYWYHIGNEELILTLEKDQ